MGRLAWQFLKDALLPWNVGPGEPSHKHMFRLIGMKISIILAQLEPC